VKPLAFEQPTKVKGGSSLVPALQGTLDVEPPFGQIRQAAAFTGHCLTAQF